MSTSAPDIFDRLKLDIFDRIDLDTEDKVIYSEEMKNLLIQEVRKEISKIPMGKIIAQILARESEKQNESRNELKSSLSKDIVKTKGEVKSDVEKLRTELNDFEEKIRTKFDNLKNDFLSFDKAPWYQFGGFSPQVNDLNIGDPGTEGGWRIVKSGNDLLAQRLESGTWVTKGGFTA